MPLICDIAKLCRRASWLRLLPIAAVAGATYMAVALAGCSNSTCSDNHSALPLMGFYSAANGEKVSLDSLEIGGVDAPEDSLLVHSGQNVNQLYLPFRNSTSTSFYIHYDYKEQGLDNPDFNDTITFRYVTEPFFASADCGAMYQYRVQEIKYTRHLIDQVVVMDSLVNNIERERFLVYFRISQQEENPDNPDNSENPDNPENPENPDNPETPVDPDNPGDETGGDQPQTPLEGRIR